MFHSYLGHFRPATTVSLQNQFLPIFKELKGMHQQDRVLFHLVRRGFNVSRSQTSSDWQSPSQRNEEAIRFANKSTPNYYPKAKDLTFENLGVAPSLNEKLSKILRISKPLEIQRLALPSIYRYRNVVIQSQTGSGKTLAYLLPTIQHSKSPCSTVIIVPTRELAYQIYIEARNLTDRRNVACYVSRKGIDTEILKLKEHPPNIIIGTPKQLLSVVQDHEFLFTNIRKIVTDEIDKMVPSIPLYNKRLIHKREKYPKAISKLLAILRGIAKEKLQYIACSATIDDLLMATLKDLGWGYSVKLIKPRAYNEKDKILPSSIKHNYVIVPDDSIDSKAAVVSKMFRRSERKNALVFVHRDHSVREYVEEMKNLHLNAVTFHQQVMSGNTGEIIKFLHDFRTGKISVVVASEEEVRGLDFKELDQVFIFDVPRRPDEYLHLAGRVGRLGRKGTVTTVVSELPETRFDRLQDMYRELDVQAEEIVL